MVGILTQEQTALLEKHIGDRRRALRTHEKFLALEISKGAKQTAFHTLSRHGHQTGWLAQLVRLMTGETPDQPFALNGVRSTIMQWERSNGSTGHYDAPTRNIRYAAADSVGAFLGPEMEVAAIQFAAVRTRHLQSAFYAEMETFDKHTRAPVRKWEPFKYIEIIAPTPQQYCGVSFVLKDKNRRPDRQTFESALEDYFNRGLGLKSGGVSLYDEVLWRQIKASGSAVPKALEAKVKVRFDSLSDLLEFLGVEAVMMKHIRLVLKRVPDNSKTWRLHTAYAVNEPTSLRPDAPGKWTGRVADTPGGPARMLSKYV